MQVKTKSVSRAEAAKRGWETRRRKRLEKIAGVLARVDKAAFEPTFIPQGETKSPVNQDEPFIKKVYPDERTAQIYSSGLEFAFVNEKGEQCHTFAFCKDFLQDAVWATLNEKPSSIHGFCYTPGKNPKLDVEESCRLAVRFKGKKDLGDLCKQSVKFLNALEKDLGFSPTVLSLGGETEPGDVWVFHGDVNWMHAPPLISMYSLLIRVGLNYEGGDWEKQLEKTSLLGSNDRDYLNKGRPAILKLKEKNFRDVFALKREDNYPKDCPIHSMHHSSGIVSLGSGGVAAAVNKNWQLKTL